MAGDEQRSPASPTGSPISGCPAAGVVYLQAAPAAPAGVRLIDLRKIASDVSSDSLRRKITHFHGLLKAAAKEHDRLDPDVVSAGSSYLVVSLLWDYTRVHRAKTAKDAKAYGSLNNAITALRWVYDEKGHIGVWSSVLQTNCRVIASGNPLRDNPEVYALRRAVKKCLIALGKVPSSTIAITAELFILIFQKFVFTDDVDAEEDRRDVAVHAICVLGMNMGLRWDEIEKVDVSSVTVTPTGARFCISIRTKNHTDDKEYSATPWPGLALRAVPAMCPLLALACWYKVRGNKPGPFFCDVVGNGVGQRLVYSNAMPVKRFCDHLRSRALAVGWSARDAERLTGHSLKRGGVQLFRLLGMSDQDIMTLMKMSSVTAYMRYTELCDASHRNDLPTFTSYEAFLAHAYALEECEEYENSCDAEDE